MNTMLGFIFSASVIKTSIDAKQIKCNAALHPLAKLIVGNGASPSFWNVPIMGNPESSS
jgi:hypothetical protein